MDSLEGLFLWSQGDPHPQPWDHHGSPAPAQRFCECPHAQQSDAGPGFGITASFGPLDPADVGRHRWGLASLMVLLEILGLEVLHQDFDHMP